MTRACDYVTAIISRVRCCCCNRITQPTPGSNHQGTLVMVSSTFTIHKWQICIGCDLLFRGGELSLFPTFQLYTITHNTYHGTTTTIADCPGYGRS